MTQYILHPDSQNLPQRPPRATIEHDDTQFKVERASRLYKVQVNVPATVTNLGPGLSTLGLALGLHTHIEMSVRHDDELQILVRGVDAEQIPRDFNNPVLKAATRVFQHQESAPAGLNISIENHIPFGVGLDAETALLIGGLIAANNMTDGIFDRELLVNLAVDVGLQRIEALTALLGGVNVCATDAKGKWLHKSFEPPPFRMVVIVPQVEGYAEKIKDALPIHVPTEAALFNIGQTVFVLDALMDGDFELLSQTMSDHMQTPILSAHIPGYNEAIQAAKSNGASAVTLASLGPTMLAFAPYNHPIIDTAMREAFAKAGISSCQSWTLGIDTQGITVSVFS